MKDSAFLDLGVIHQAFSLREENPKDDTFRSVLCELSNLIPSFKYSLFYSSCPVQLLDV